MVAVYEEAAEPPRLPGIPRREAAVISSEYDDALGGELTPPDAPVPAEPAEIHPSGRIRSLALCLATAASPAVIVEWLAPLLLELNLPPALRLPSPSVAVELYESTRDVILGLRGVACICAYAELSALRMYPRPGPSRGHPKSGANLSAKECCPEMG